MHSPDIWTSDVRRVLYRRLVELFGSVDDWQKITSPGRGKDAAFDRFCDLFAEVVGAKSGEAVKHQIAFARPETAKGSHWNSCLTQVAMLNKTAALEAGFIRSKHLPTVYAVGPKVKEIEFSEVNESASVFFSEAEMGWLTAQKAKHVAHRRRGKRNAQALLS